jgi:hypothetical protein
MKLRRRILSAALGVIVLAAFYRPGISWADEGEDLANLNAQVARLPVPEIPAGPYAGWFEEDKKSAFEKVGFPCVGVCGDAYQGLHRPNSENKRTEAETIICVTQCVGWHLPPDYPLIPKLKEKLDQYYEKAHQSGSPLPPPTISPN